MADSLDGGETTSATPLDRAKIADYLEMLTADREEAWHALCCAQRRFDGLTKAVIGFQQLLAATEARDAGQRHHHRPRCDAAVDGEAGQSSELRRPSTARDRMVPALARPAENEDDDGFEEELAAYRPPSAPSGAGEKE